MKPFFMALTYVLARVNHQTNATNPFLTLMMRLPPSLKVHYVDAFVDAQPAIDPITEPECIS
jgi:hypothetical protein